MKNKLLRVEKHPNGIITITPHLPPLQIQRFGRGGGRTKRNGSTNEFMSYEDYRTTLRRWYRETLRNLLVDYSLCRFVTLTLDRDMEWAEFKRNLDRFMRAVERAFPNTEYLRAIEIQPENRRLHAHILYLFSGAVPKVFTLSWIEETWKCGICHLRTREVDHGAFQYVTLAYKDDCTDEFTRFPYGAKVLAKSRNFGTLVSPTTTFLPEDKVNSFVYKCFELAKTKQGMYVRVDQHYFPDYATGEIRTCWDRVYINIFSNDNELWGYEL